LPFFSGNFGVFNRDLLDLSAGKDQWTVRDIVLTIGNEFK